MMTILFLCTSVMASPHVTGFASYGVLLRYNPVLTACPSSALLYRC